MTEFGDTRAAQKRLKFAIDGEQELLPGIPNDITMDLITPKLWWRDLPVLSSVSPNWRRVNESRQVYDARMRFESSETLVLVNYAEFRDGARVDAVGIYSMRENSFFELPPIQPMRWLKNGCGIVVLDGRVYAMGGRLDRSRASNKVYVFDLVGNRLWQECASMKEPRDCFACGVVGGMIYVFGSPNMDGFLYGSEIYDPAKDMWHPIMPMSPYKDALHHFATLLWDTCGLVAEIGGEIVVHGPELYQGREDFQVYHPGKNEWKEMSVDSMPGYNKLFAAGGKLYAMNCCEIHVLDLDERSWKLLHTFSFDAIGGSILFQSGWSVTVSVVDGELLALVYQGRESVFRIIQSTGFGAGTRQVIWKLKGKLFSRHFIDGGDILCPFKI